jgi:hypothetical protein
MIILKKSTRHLFTVLYQVNFIKSLNHSKNINYKGFGQTGPYSKRGGYDVVASAMFGLMNITGFPVKL